MPVSVKTGVSAVYTLSAANISDFALSGKVLLEDLKTGTTQDLKVNSSYTFSANSGDSPDRFHLHFGEPYGIGDDSDPPGFTVFVVNNSVYIKNISSQDLEGNVSICNILGQEITQARITGQMTKLDLTAPSGWYLVTIVTGNQTYSRKIFMP